MTTTIYFVRHAEPNYKNHHDAERELTEKGLADTPKVTAFLIDKGVNFIYSSPFKRAVDTVKHLSETIQLPIHTIEDFRERKIDSVWIEDFDSFTRQQWADFSYKLSDGESLGQVQARNLAALEKLLEKHPDQTLVVGSHGTALSSLINYFQPQFGLADFQAIKHLFPFVVRLTFDGKICTSMDLYDILQEPTHETSLL